MQKTRIASKIIHAKILYLSRCYNNSFQHKLKNFDGCFFDSEK